MKLSRLFVRVLVSLGLLPLTYAVGRSFFDVIFLLNRSSNISSPWIYFVCGFIGYMVFQTIFFKPIRIYIFGHELTHALASFISGGKIKSFRVKKSGGSVVLTKTNLFVTLSPYFIPIYALLLVILYGIIQQFSGIEATTVGHIHNYFLVLLGMAISFHLALTIFAVYQGQSDLKKYGVFNSLLIVFIINCIILSILFSLFFQIKLDKFFIDAGKYIYGAFTFILNELRSKQIF